MTANHILDTAQSFLGFNEKDGSYRKILEIYNNHKPLAVGYPLQWDDDWCDAFVSVVGIEADAVDIIGTECGCERHVRIWQAMGIWLEDGRITPEPGDIIVYSWKHRAQPNNGFADHVGFVESVRDGKIHTIEGNRTAGTGNPAVWRMELPTIRTGSKGDTVKAMQGILIARGYLCGESGADGICGPGTVASVSRFQAAHGLAADGICGQRTWRRLLGV